ncbi:MAG: methenyltetrahydromethanopterin cyclohydrolase [Thermoproteota archaeon]|nr:methenyltetrahydromethanopterin cyclohydrolase [Thermoproteota archaeon]
MSQRLKVNENSLHLVKKIIEDPEVYGIIVESKHGAKILDCGLNARGGYEVGRIITEICLGGYGRAEISSVKYDDFVLPAIFVYSDHPAIALLGSQFAGWRIKVGKYQAIGSGPARALALKPKELYEKIDYHDTSDSAIVFLETSAKPTNEVIEYIAKECKVELNRLFVLLAPTSSLAGSTQISGRVIESGLHKLMEVGLDIKSVSSGFGYAPIAPLHPNSAEAMGRTNDMILYGGVVYLTVEWNDDEELKRMVERAPSLNSNEYGKPFYEIYKEAGYDFYRIDSSLFAPAMVMINNVRTGRFFKAGQLNSLILRQSVTS